ncbi:ABC transporter substrate-binding protein [Deinococcus pimensis]|uniref:ABC transporter substrate-binding protein n=1 Tax=Deinococcus pimensis TaxID=309888 RepID=UPI00048603D6|nr:ABC transporter substrate-binding protein [Deinococcus pimensis]
MKKAHALIPFLLLTFAAAASPSSTLVIMESSDVPTLDPAQSYDTGSGAFVENIYETLLQYKGNSLKELTPLLATDYKASNGGKTYTFTLRKGVKFHSGNTLSCDDAEYTFRRILVVNNAEGPMWFLAESLLGTSKNANDDKSVTWDKITKAVDCNAQGQLVFNLVKPDPTFLAKLVFQAMGIEDKKHAVKIGEWDGTEKTWKQWVGKSLNDSAMSEQPSGTGAYQLVRRDANNVILKAFPGYWGKKPDIENVVVQRVPEQATRLEAFKRGDADLIETGPRGVLEQLRGVPGVVVEDDLPSAAASTIFMNQKINDPKALGSGKLDGKGIPANFFSDVNVRRGFSYAFDYGRYIKEVQQGKGKQRTMALPESFPGYDENVKKYTFNPKLAADYFKRAWGGELWKNGFVLNANYRAGSIAAQTGMELLKSSLEAINPKFKVNIQAKQWSEMLKDADASKEAMISLAWVADYADPDNFMYTYYSSKGYYSPRLNYLDKNVDAWLDQARATTDVKKREQLYSLVGNRAFETAPVILLPAGIGFTVHRDTLMGVGKNTYNPMRSFSYTGTYWRDLSKK